MNKYTVGSLFAGVGGICQAFKNAGCNVLWANEIDKHSCKTYRLNHKETILIEDDVRNIRHEILQHVDILTAGFPCQPFSQAGKGKGFDDERGLLFHEVTRLLKELSPEAYLLENVKTLATHKNGSSFELIRKEIYDSNYSFIPFILNASEYSEIPQGRERLYIIGFKNEKGFFYDKPVKENYYFDDNTKSSSFKIPTKRQHKCDDIYKYLEKTSTSIDDYYNDINNKIHRIVLEGVKSKNNVYQYRRWYVRENKSNVCPTLTANMGAGGHNVPIILDGDTPRRLSPKECFNLQGFPRDFVLPLDVAKGQLYKQSGNAVVVPLVTIIAREMVKVLYENRDSQS
jgi:DNA (cytosine-5)-methyltransferase 1